MGFLTDPFETETSITLFVLPGVLAVPETVKLIPPAATPLESKV